MYSQLGSVLFSALSAVISSSADFMITCSHHRFMALALNLRSQPILRSFKFENAYDDISFVNFIFHIHLVILPKSLVFLAALRLRTFLSFLVVFCYLFKSHLLLTSGRFPTNNYNRCRSLPSVSCTLSPLSSCFIFLLFNLHNVSFQVHDI